MSLLSRIGTEAAQWLGVASTLVASATAIFTTQQALAVNQSNARDRFFERQLQSCLDLGDASGPVQRALSELTAGYAVVDAGQPAMAEPIFKQGETQVAQAYAEYQTVMNRMFVLYPDTFTPLIGQVVAATPTTLRIRADATDRPSQTFKDLRNGFTQADIKLREACTAYLRDYARANLLNGDRP